MIQAKRYGPNTTVGSPVIQQYASLAHQENGVNNVLIVTTNGFSRQALEITNDLNVKTIDGNGLVHVIWEEEAEGLVDEYVPLPEAGSRDPSSTPEPGFETGKPVSGTSIRRGIAGWPCDGRLGSVRRRGSGNPVFLSNSIVMIFLIVWSALPIAIVLDGRAVKKTSGWSPRWLIYTIAAIIPGVGLIVGPIYLFRRWQQVGRSH